MPKGSASSVKSQHRMDPYHERINNAKRKHQHRAKIQVVNRKKAAKDNVSRSSQGSLFEDSRNVEIGGGHFSSARGHHANFTINFNQSAMDEEDDINPENANDAPVHPVMDHEPSSTPNWRLQPLPSQRSCDIYYRHLAAKRRGSPLWLPEPSSTLPNAYRRQGIAIGDVGIITSSGGFDFMFNICLPADHPINQQGLPEGFSPLFPQIHSSDIHRHTEFNPNSHLASASVEKSLRASDLSGIEFTSSASEGAILTMPQGAQAEDLANISRFRQYLSENSQSWYRYVNNVRGREARNGDVRLVVGCDKASSWGMATFANSTTQDFHLKFKPTGETGSTRTYGWEYSGMVEARAGPDPEEMDELRRDDFGHPGVYKNQCLFVRTLNATLQDDVWQGLGFDFETAMDIQYDLYPNSYIHSYDSSSSLRSSSPPGLSRSNSTTNYGTPGSTRSSSPSPSLPESVYIGDFNTALTAHPSKTMNAFLLAAYPHARIAITEDKDWISLMADSDQRLPPPEELINRMLVDHDVCEADGVVFLRSKQEKTPTNNPSINERSEQVNHDTMEQLLFESGLLELPSPPQGQTSRESTSSQPTLDPIFESNPPPYASRSSLPSPLFLHPILSPPTHRPENSIQFDLLNPVDLLPVDLWNRTPLFRDSGALSLLDTHAPALPTSPREFVPGTLQGSWSGQLITSPYTQDTEPPSLLPPPGEFDWGAELSNFSPALSGTPLLDGCISTLTSIYRNINEVRANKEQCRALSERCKDLLAALQSDLGARSFYDSTIQEETERVITRLDRKVKEYGSWNKVKTLLRQHDIRSELSSLQTDMGMIIEKISIFGHTRTVGNMYASHAARRRKRTTRASVRALEEAFASNPKPNAVLRKQLAETLEMPERSIQVWFQNRRAKERYRQRPPNLPEGSTLVDQDKDSADSGFLASTIARTHGDDPLLQLGGSRTHGGTIRPFESLSRGRHLAHAQRTRYTDLRTNHFVIKIRIQPTLADFGVSSEMLSESPSSSLSTGSPAYFAPEVISPAINESMGRPTTDVWNIGALLLSALNPNSSALAGAEQHDPRRFLGSTREEPTAFSTHSNVMTLRRKPQTTNTTRKSILGHDNLAPDPEDIDDGISMSNRREIREDHEEC